MRLDRLVLLREGDAAPRWWVIDLLGTEPAALRVTRRADECATWPRCGARRRVAEVRGGFTGDGRFVESAPN